ncbi:MAG: hypothetical protein ABGZ53_25120 [Fuerstiella sp.]|nr:hypothetical protein [Fuerstiella sp.]
MSDADDTQMSDDARIWVADRNCLYEDVAVVLRRAETVIPAVIGGTSAEVRDQLLVEIQGHIQRLRDVLRIATGMVPQAQPPLPLKDAVLATVQELPDEGNLRKFREHLSDIERHLMATEIDRAWSAPYAPGQYRRWIGESQAESVPATGPHHPKGEPLPSKTWQRRRKEAERRHLLVCENSKSIRITRSLAEAWGIAHLMPDWK